MDGSLYDYRVFCFNGKPNFILVDMDASTFNEDGKYLRSIYTTEWEKLKNVTIYHKYYNGNIDKPIFLEEVLKISNKLSSNFIHLRVDFYIIDNKPFVGELTFTHQNGIGEFMPQEYDYKFGELLELPKEKRIEYNFSDRETFIKQSCILEPVSFEYKRLERELSLKNKETISNNDYQKLRLNCNWWTLFGISNNNEYLRLTLFGIRISIKMNKEKVDNLAWFIPVKKWRENFRNKFFDNFIGGGVNDILFIEIPYTPNYKIVLKDEMKIFFETEHTVHFNEKNISLLMKECNFKILDICYNEYNINDNNLKKNIWLGKFDFKSSINFLYFISKICFNPKNAFIDYKISDNFNFGRNIRIIAAKNN